MNIAEHSPFAPLMPRGTGFSSPQTGDRCRYPTYSLEKHLGTYCWIAVQNAEPSVFVNTEVFPGYSFRFAETDPVSVVDGDNFGATALSTDWALLMFSGDCIDSPETIQKYANAFGAGTTLVVVNMSSPVMCSDFSLFSDSKLRCSVVHKGCDDTLHLEKTGRLPNGGRKIIDNAFAMQRGETAVDYIYSIPQDLAVMATGFRLEGEKSKASAIGGFRLLEQAENAE